MSQKPTYEELELRVKALEEKALERKQDDELLLREKDFSESMIDSLPGIFYLFDEKGKFIRWNKNLESVSEYSGGEIATMSPLDFFVGEDKRNIEERIQDAFMKGEAFIEAAFVSKSGSETPYYLTGRRLKIGDANYLAGMGINIIDQKQSEEALRGSEERYRTLLDSIEEAYFEVDIAGNFTFLNDALSKSLGYSNDELMGMNNRDYMSPESAKKIQNLFNQIYTTGKPTKKVTYEIIRKDGSRGFHELSASLMKDQAGQPIGFSGIAHDITERKQVGEALRESEERFSGFARASGYGFAMGELSGQLVFGNPATLRIVEEERETDFIAKTFYQYYSEEDKEFLITDILPTVMEKGQWKGELPLLTAKGNLTPTEQNIFLISDRHGNSQMVGNIITDITDRKRTDEALRESEEKYRTILESIEDGYFEVDIAGNLTFCNDSLCKTLGYSKDELMGMNNRQYTDEENTKELYQTFNRVYSTGKPDKGFDWTIIRKDGTKGGVEASVSLRKDVEGEPIGFRGVVRDISEKQSLEAQLHHAQRMESIGTLAGGIAHNFNNLLMGIQGNASIMLLDIDSSNPSYKNLMNIEKLVENGAKLTSQLIGYAREGSYEVKPISLNQLVKETSDTFGMTKKEITVHQEPSEKLYGIKADQGQIEQVLLNLYVNAADAMRGGGDLYLKTMNVTDKDMTDKPYEAKPGNYVLLTVKDTGVGMDKETKERIFEPFFTTKGLASGTGLGMASAYGIIKGHGGYIDVDSKKGEGTTFSIYLPATEEDLEEKKVSSDEFVKGKGTVLLVDDEEMILDAVEEMLKHLGYEVLLAKDGQEALGLYKKNQDKVDLVLLDMVMPIMGGGKTFDRMKEINSDVKVLLSSGYSIEGEAKEILKRGCDAFIQKPFKPEQLSQKLREILDKK